MNEGNKYEIIIKQKLQNMEQLLIVTPDRWKIKKEIWNQG